MKNMAESMEDLLTIDGNKLDFQKITDIFLTFSEAKYAIFNLFDEDGESFSTIAISGSKEIIRSVEALLDFKIDGKKLDVDHGRDKRIKAHTINRFASLMEFVGDIIPFSKLSLVVKNLKLGEVVLIKISRKNVILGDLTLIMPEGIAFNKENLAIIFARQLSLAITYKRSEKTLIENEKAISRHNSLLSSLLKNLSIGVYMVEVPSGKPMVANKIALNLLGRGIFPEINNESNQEVYKILKKSSNNPYQEEEMPIAIGMSGKTSYVNDMIIERPDGTRTQLEVFGTPVADDSGQIWASLISFNDITERVKLESDLANEKNLLETTLFSVGDAVLSTDKKGNIVLGIEP